MTFKKLMKGYNLNDFFYQLNILKIEKKLIELNIYPDYDATTYVKYQQKDYIFFDSQDFDDKYDSVIKSSIIEYGFYDSNSEDVDSDEDKISDELYDLGHFNDLKLIAIHNIEKTITFFGAYFGDYSTDHPDYPAVALCIIVYIPKHIKTKEFHLQLLAESRVLYEENKSNLAFFTAFSAIDLYINEKEKQYGLEKIDNDGKIIQQRLEDRLKAVYKKMTQISDLSKDIWSVLIEHFKILIDIRNDIAHGEKVDEVTEQEYKLLIAVIFSLIMKMENPIESPFR